MKEILFLFRSPTISVVNTLHSGKITNFSLCFSILLTHCRLFLRHPVVFLIRENDASKTRVAELASSKLNRSILLKDNFTLMLITDITRVTGEPVSLTVIVTEPKQPCKTLLVQIVCCVKLLWNISNFLLSYQLRCSETSLRD